MKPIPLSALLALPVFLTACAYFESKPEPLDMNVAVLKAETYETQEQLADYYAKAAADLSLRANDTRLLGNQYEGKTYLYGQDGRDAVNLSERLANIYERAAAENRRMAEIHRRVAVQLPCTPVGLSGKGALIPCHLPTAGSASDR
ncbi:hypothetical protein [Methylomagnum sp.]